MQTLQCVASRRVLALLTAVVGGAAVAAPPSYRVTVLDMPAGYSQPRLVDINDHDQVLGDLIRASTPNRAQRPFLWSPGTGLVLGPQPRRTEIRQMNALDDQGRVVGADSCHTCNQLGFHWKPGAPVRLLTGLYDGAATSANGVNAQGVIVGASYGSAALQEYHAVTWSAADGLVDRQPAGVYSSTGAGINADGQVVGWMKRETQGATHAMVLAPGGHLTDLGALPGGRDSYGRAINEAGMVVGASTFEASFPMRAFVWTAASGMRELTAGSAYEGWNGEANDLDDAGEVVGSAYQSEPFVSIAYRWTAADGLRPLVDLVDPADPLAGRVAFEGSGRINEAGHIAVLGTLDGVERVFVLTPL